LEQTPIATLWQAVNSQTGPSRAWHVDDLYAHEGRYLADLAAIAQLAPMGTVLEIGAAPCHMTALLKLHGYSAVGVDINPGRVADLIERFGLDVRCCDIERSPLPFTDETFACAMLCETFEHLRIDPAFVLSEINRVLEPDGALLLTTPNVYSLPSSAAICSAAALPIRFRSSASFAASATWATFASTRRAKSPAFSPPRDSACRRSITATIRICAAAEGRSCTSHTGSRRGVFGARS
jgi:SAM-dependent methyltransferase